MTAQSTRTTRRSAAASADRGQPTPRRTAAQRVLAFFSRDVVHIVLLLIAVFWLVPTFGLPLTSLRSTGDNASSGWWTVFTKPAELTIQNYADLLANPTITGSFWNTIVIAVPTTILVVVLGALAAYAFAWLHFPGRDLLLIAVIVLLAVPLQVALIPLARLFGALGIFGSVVGVILFHTAFGLTVAIQLQLRQLGSNIDVLSAGAFLSMVVPLIVFFVFQRYFVQALLAGSQK